MSARSRRRIRAMLHYGAAIYWDADVLAYLQGSGPITTGQADRLTKLVVGVKQDFGISKLADFFDCFWVIGNETAIAGRRNLAKNDHHCTEAGTITFTAFQGYAGNGTTGYLATDYIPSTDAIAASLNSVHVSIYDRTNRTDNASVHGISARNASPAQELGVAPRFTSANVVRINDSASGVANSTAQGFYLGNRSASNAVQKYRNGAALTPTSTASVGLPTVQMYIGARNIDDVAGAFTTDQIAFASVGKSMTATQVAQFTTRVETYMDSISAGVI